LKLSLFDHFINSFRFWLKGEVIEETLWIVSCLIFSQERFACDKGSHLVVAIHFEYIIDHELEKCFWRRFVVDVYYLLTLLTYRRNQLVFELVSRIINDQWCINDQENIRRWLRIFVNDSRFYFVQKIVNIVIENNVGSQMSNVNVRSLFSFSSFFYLWCAFRTWYDLFKSKSDLAHVILTCEITTIRASKEVKITMQLNHVVVFKLDISI